jgi:hypothetical protein
MRNLSNNDVLRLPVDDPSHYTAHVGHVIASTSMSSSQAAQVPQCRLSAGQDLKGPTVRAESARTRRCPTLPCRMQTAVGQAGYVPLKVISSAVGLRSIQRQQRSRRDCAHQFAATGTRLTNGPSDQHQRPSMSQLRSADDALPFCGTRVQHL